MNTTWLKSLLPYGVLAAIYLVVIVVFDFNGLYGQDSHEYLRFAKELKQSFMLGTAPGYFHWPKFYPVLGAIVSYSGISVLHAMQFISILACFGTIWLAQRSIQLMNGTKGVWLLLLGACTQTYFMRSGMYVMSDALCAFFVMGVFYLYLRLLQKNAVKFYLLMILLSALAVYTRYASIPILIVPIIHSTYQVLVGVRAYTRIGLATLLFVLIGLSFTFNEHLSKQIIEHLSEWKISNLFHRTHYREVRLEVNLVPNIIYIWSNFFHVGFLIFGFLLVPWIKKWSWNYRGLWIAILIYLVFIGGLEIQNQRFMVLSHMPVLLLVYPGFAELWDWLRSRKLQLLFTIGVFAANLSFFYYSFSKTYKVHRIEKEISEQLMKYDHDVWIYSFYVDQSFSSYGLTNHTENLWLMEKPEFIIGSLVVFNEEKFKVSWSDHRLMHNWKKLNEDHELQVLDTLRDNWKIYRIQ